MIERDKLFFRLFCITFWAMALLNIFLEEVLMIQGESARNVFYTYFNSLFFIGGLFLLRKKSDIALIVVFIALGIVSSLYNRVPWLSAFDDLRRTVSTLMVLPVVRYFFTCKRADEFRDSFDRQLKIFLILQAFAMVFQFFKYGAGDHGGGTLGYVHSGNISIIIISLSLYFVAKNWDGENYLKSLWRNRLYVFLLFPVFLNETKVSFVFLAVYFIVLFPFHIRSVGKALIAGPFILLVAIAALSAYMAATDGHMDVFSQTFYDDYLTGGSNASELMEDAQEAADFVEELTNKVDEGEWLFLDIPRFMKIGLLFPALAETSGGFVLGAGFGHLSDFIHPTSFTEQNIVALYGTRMMIHYTFLPLGLLGLVWMFFWYKNILAMRSRPYKMSFPVKLFLLSVILVVFVYNEFFNQKIGCVIFYYICFANTYRMKSDDEKLINETNAVNNSAGV